jgi:hypothetical protein
VGKAGTNLAVSIGVLVAGALAGIGCGRSRPVASLSVEPTSVNLPHAYAASLRLLWNPTADLAGLEGTPLVFVHVLDGGRRLLRTFDHPLPEAWTPGRPQSYEVELYQSAIAEPLPAGAYEMTFGLYDDAGRRRWPLAVDGEEVGRREYRIATLVVPADTAPAPAFEFAGAWKPVESGSSKQVIARRCLSAGGSISVTSPSSAGTVRVAASIVAGGPPGSTPWRVDASCSPETLEVVGQEVQWTGFSVVAAAQGPACEIRFTPPAAMGGKGLHLLCLEVLAWRPGAP